MNDYLGNLAARTLGELSLVQPRLASRFEATASPLALNASDTPGQFQQRAAPPEEVEEELFEAPTAPAEKARPTARRAWLSEQATDDLLEPVKRGVAPLAPASASFSIETATAQFQANDAKRQPTRAEQGVASPPLPRPPTAELAQTEHAYDSVQGVAKLFPAPEPPEVLLQPATRRANAPRPPAGEEPPDRAAENPDGKSSEAPPRLMSLQSVDWPPPVLPAMAPAPPLASAVAREPVIKVTIGRVEVRAVLPTPPAPAVTATQPAQRAQALPLDEYLRRRNHGEL